MVSSERKMSLFIPDLEPLKNMKKKEKEDTWVSVREEELKMQECQRRFFGFEDKEF